VQIRRNELNDERSAMHDVGLLDLELVVGSSMVEIVAQRSDKQS